MAERRPPGFNVDLGFYDSEEVLSIPRKIRAAAVGVWTLCGSYSANKLSDGYVSEEALRDRGCTAAIRAALTSTIPEPLWVNDHVSGIWFTRWPKWQRTCAEVKAYREADAERKRKAREARRNGTTSENGETSARTSGGPSQSVRADSGTPKTETKTETKTSNSYVNEEATDSSGLAAIAATPGADLVRKIIPDEHPNAIRSMLRIRASELIKAGTPTATVAAALELWLTKPHLGPNVLPSLVSEVIRNRTPVIGGHDAKVNDYLAFANNPHRQEIE